MADDFYPFVDSGDPAPDNAHLNGITSPAGTQIGAPAAGLIGSLMLLQQVPQVQ